MLQDQHRSTARVLDILEELAFSPDGEGFTFTELATTLGAPKSSLFPIIHTLEERKYIQKDRQSGKYSIGIRTCLLNAGFQDDGGIKLVSKIMHSIVDVCEETCQLGVLDEGNVFYIQKVDSPQKIRMISHVGTKLPANSTAIGKALLSGLDDEAVKALYPGGLPRLTENTIVDMHQLLSQLNDIRGSGIAWEKEESTPQLSCWAVPLYSQGIVFAALSVTVPLFRCSDEKEQIVRTCLLNARKEIEQLAKSRKLSLA
ncbi:MAG: IclR family transcriptional regulator [Oscillibacter sp.]|nr:IclR family transcriptional regulator [Oscillibacter sp.]